MIKKTVQQKREVSACQEASAWHDSPLTIEEVGPAHARSAHAEMRVPPRATLARPPLVALNQLKLYSLICLEVPLLGVHAGAGELVTAKTFESKVLVLGQCYCLGGVLGSDFVGVKPEEEIRAKLASHQLGGVGAGTDHHVVIHRTAHCVADAHLQRQMLVVKWKIVLIRWRGEGRRACEQVH